MYTYDITISGIIYMDFFIGQIRNLDFWNIRIVFLENLKYKPHF